VDFATALLCAEAIGAMQFANDTTLEYLKTRKQFGVPIGSFQVLQHRMVEMFVTTEQARSMAILAAQQGRHRRRRGRAPARRVRRQDQDRRRCRHVSQESCSCTAAWA
jgi:alkylation response protein AidB-like acyl-CoA dehydrogenase